MKRIYFVLILLLLGIVSCEKEKYAPGDIDIEFQFDTLPVDLNLAETPYITCVINSETPLEKVSMYIVSSNDERQYKEDISSFFNPTSCSIFERPVYQDNMIGFKVVAYDKGGGTVSKTMKMDIVSAVTAPKVSFGQEKLSFSEGDPIPDFTFSVKADADIDNVKVDLIESGSVLELVMPIDVFDNPHEFNFDSRDYVLAEYSLNKIPSSIRVTASDKYGKVTMSLLYIDYKALPYPTVKVDELAPVDEFSGCEVKGVAESETGIASVKWYSVGENAEMKIAEVEASGETVFPFSCEVSGDYIRDYITAIKTVVRDRRDKETVIETPLTVNPKLYPVAADDDLLAILKQQASDDSFRSIKLSLAADGVYSLGSSSYKISKTLIIEGEDGGDMPQIVTNSSYSFITDGAVVDSVVFRKVRFTSDKAGGFMNNTGGCTIKRIVFDGCTFDGLFSQVLYRAAGGNNIGEISVNDCQIWWNNTSGAYAFFHFTQNSDRISSVSLTNSTIAGVFYLLYCNITNSMFDARVEHCTFVNQKGSSSGYHVSFSNSSLTGKVVFKDNLYGGTNNITGAYRMLRANKLTSDCSGNWCTPSWKTFTDDSTNGSINFVKILPENEDNDDIFEDAASGNYTLKTGTSVYTNKIGDPRWIK